jgi:hypothetical protein
MNNLNVDKIKKLLAKLAGGEDVSKRDLKNTLGEDGLNEYIGLWEQEKDRRSIYENKPEDIKEYEAILKKADFANSKADGIKINKRSTKDMRGRYANERLRTQAESLYEDALIKLEEIITKDKTLVVWFDRELDFTTNGTIGPDNVAIPRVVTSRSSTNMANGISKGRTKEEIKRDVLEMALNNSEAKEVSDKDKAKLKLMLNKLKVGS